MAEEENKSLINVKDLAGVSAPLTKLVETVEGAFGRMSDGIDKVVTSYFLANRDARNEAERIELVESAKTRAMAQRVQALAALSDSTATQLKSIKVNPDGTIGAQLVGIPAEVQNLQNRAAQRLVYQNAIQQLNIESVTGVAAEELANESKVASEPVKPDWTTRFFRNAQDISNAQVQLIFGKILAGEVRQPGAFSLRTIDFLSTLAQDEGEMFRDLCSFAFSRGSDFQVIHFDDEAKNFNIPQLSFSQLQHLQSIGLIIHSTGFMSGYIIKQEFATFLYGSDYIEVEARHNTADKKAIIDVGNVALTNMGNELAMVCQPAVNPCILEYLVKTWEQTGHKAVVKQQVAKPSPLY